MLALGLERAAQVEHERGRAGFAGQATLRQGACARGVAGPERARCEETERLLVLRAELEQREAVRSALAESSRAIALRILRARL